MAVSLLLQHSLFFPCLCSDLTNGETRSVQSSSNVAVHSLSVPSSSDVTNGETRTVPISLNPSLSVPSSSAITNGETRSVPVSSNLSVLPSSRALTNVKPKREDTRMISASGPPMDEVLRGLHVPSKQNVTKAPVKADSPFLHQKPDATNPPMDTRQQSIATAFGTYPSSEPHNNQQGLNHFKSLVQVPSSQYGNMINSPYWRPNQNESYDMAPSAAPFQQRGGSNSNTLAHHGNMMSSPNTWLGPDIYQCLDSVFAPYRNRTLPLSATSTVSSSHGSAYDFGNAANSRLGYEDVSRNHLPSNSSSTSSIGPSSHASAYGFDMSGGSIPRVHLPSNWSGTSSIGLSSHGSAFGFDMTSGNNANSRLGYEDVSRSHFPSNSIGSSSHVNGSNSRLGYGDYLPPVHHQV
ncbi:hypothetical protein N665_0004s0053 [Sinapis alba]|nr:hypothetical protein N665_0004s0053 [Sinapis alba]